MSEDIRVLVVDESPGLAQGLICALPGRRAQRARVPSPTRPAAARRVAAGAGQPRAGRSRPRGRGRASRSLGDPRRGPERTRVLGHDRPGRGPDLAAGALAAGACGVVTPEPDGARAWWRCSVGRSPASSSCPRSTSSNLVDRLRDGRETCDRLQARVPDHPRARDPASARRRRVDRARSPAIARDQPDDGAEPREEHLGQAGRALEGRGGHAGVALRPGIGHPAARDATGGSLPVMVGRSGRRARRGSSSPTRTRSSVERSACPAKRCPVSRS